MIAGTTNQRFSQFLIVFTVIAVAVGAIMRMPIERVFVLAISLILMLMAITLRSRHMLLFLTVSPFIAGALPLLGHEVTSRFVVARWVVLATTIAYGIVLVCTKKGAIPDSLPGTAPVW